MKKINFQVITAILLVLLILLTVPTFTKRKDSEALNKNVVVSLHYSDLANKFSGESLDTELNKYLDAGVNVVSVLQENINAMANRGDLTNIKYGVLRHKYDDESLILADIIAEKAPNTSYNSQLFITKNEKMAEFLRKSMREMYSPDEYAEISGNNGITCFSLYDGTLPTYELTLGFDEEAISHLYDMGFDICLVLKVQNLGNTEYLDTLERLVEAYNVKYMNIKKSAKSPANEADGKEHYERIANIIDDHNMTLVVTENTNQLSNEKPFGYNTIFLQNSDKVIRSYETYDATHADSTKYLFRYQQYLNSTIDRNIRFITLTQIYLPNIPYVTLSDYTVKAAETYIDKIASLGYTVNGEVSEIEYNTNLTLVRALVAAMCVFMVYLMLTAVFEYRKNWLFYLTILFSALAFLATFKIPQALLSLYPTAWALILPCFGLTACFTFLKKYSEKLCTVVLALITPALLALLMAVGGLVMSSLLSGIDYYINNDIFRGIKITLFFPIVYAVAAFYLMFIKGQKNVLAELKNIATMKIEVYWLAILALVGVVGIIYIRRSGNVNSISSLESTMRSLITEFFTARPRTKEFLIGYPCLVLLVYYLKNTNIKIIQLILAAGSAIVAASISNSFCHVFTDSSTIFMRVVNGLILGLIVSTVAYLANLILVKIVKKILP